MITRLRCSCCGQEVADAHTVEELCAAFKLTRTQETILSVLAEKSGRFVSKARIIDAMYAHRIDGGPDNAENVLKVQISHLRKALSGQVSFVEGFTSGIKIVADNSTKGRGSIGHGLGYRIEGLRP